MLLCELRKQAAFLSHVAPDHTSDAVDTISNSTALPFIAGAGLGGLAGYGLHDTLGMDPVSATKVGMILGAIPGTAMGIHKGLGQLGVGGAGNTAKVYGGSMGGALLGGAGLGIAGGTMGAGIGALVSGASDSDLRNSIGLGGAIGGGLGLLGGASLGSGIARYSILEKLLGRR